MTEDSIIREDPKPGNIVTSEWKNRSVYYQQVFQDPINRLSKADPSNVQEVVASQLDLLTSYHAWGLEQARRGFLFAVAASVVGLMFFIAAVVFVLVFRYENASTISVISGALVEVVAGLNFYLYNKTSAQLSEFQSHLDQTQRYLLANSICESLDDSHKQQARSQLVLSIVNAMKGNPGAETEKPPSG